MLKILTVIVFVGLLCLALRLVLQITWGTAKIVASILAVVALPMLVISLIITSSLLLLVPIVLIAAAVIILKVLL